MSVALHHLLQWVDKGIVPPKSTRIWKDRDGSDGSPMVLDELGNPAAASGIRMWTSPRRDTACRMPAPCR
jgi:hypothetical protein